MFDDLNPIELRHAEIQDDDFRKVIRGEFHAGPAAMEALFSRLDPILERFFKPSVRGLGRIPEGPALYVANHNAGVLMPDMFIIGSIVVINSPVEEY